MIEAIGRAIGRAGANFMRFAGATTRANHFGEDVTVELYRLRLDALPTAYYCCEGTCDGECTTTDTPREAKDWWNGNQ